MTTTQLRALVRRRQKKMPPAMRRRLRALVKERAILFSGWKAGAVPWFILASCETELDTLSGGRWLGHHAKRAAFLKEIGLSVGETK